MSVFTCCLVGVIYDWLFASFVFVADRNERGRCIGAPVCFEWHERHFSRAGVLSSVGWFIGILNRP